MTAAADPSLADRWLPFSASEGDTRLYCLPHAGGSASTYRAWAEGLERVAARPLQPPGRETRLRETPHTRMEPMVAELADVVLADAGGGPYAVYGHSLGALVGYELLREINRRGGPPPIHFLVSGCGAPHLETENATHPVSRMNDPEVVAFLRRLGGTPDWLLSDPSVLEMILPPFRADFAIKETYRHRPSPPMDIPITAIASTADPRADPAAVAAWAEHTTDVFRSHILPGGHFAILEHPELAHHHLAEALRP